MPYDYSRVHPILKKFGDRLQSPLLLIIRLFWGGSFVITGMGKLAHLGNVTEYFQSLGVPFAEVNAVLVASAELIGGSLLFLGLASRLVSIPLIILMLTAFGTAEIEAVQMIFSNPQNFIHRDPFSFLFACLLVFVFGAGNISLDYWLWERNKTK